MKKLIILFFIAVFITGIISAQPIMDQYAGEDPQNTSEVKPEFHPRTRNEHMRTRDEHNHRTHPKPESEQMRRTPPENRDGQQREISTVTITGILKLDGRTEEKSITVEGYQFRNFIRPVKIIFDGRTYDIPQFNYRQRCCCN